MILRHFNAKERMVKIIIFKKEIPHRIAYDDENLKININKYIKNVIVSTKI